MVSAAGFEPATHALKVIGTRRHGWLLTAPSEILGNSYRTLNGPESIARASTTRPSNRPHHQRKMLMSVDPIYNSLNVRLQLSPAQRPEEVGCQDFIRDRPH